MFLSIYELKISLNTVISAFFLIKRGEKAENCYIPGRPLIRGHFFQNSLASTIYIQIAQYSDMLRKIG